MARPAPAVTRAVRVIDLLVTSPSERPSQSEIVRRTGMSAGSGHAVLAALTEGGYLVRDPDTKLYGLGPSLLAAGYAALDSVPAVREAVREIGSLATELSCETVATAATRTDIIVLAQRGALSAYGVEMRVGQRVPLVPPFGAVFVAWAGTQQVADWLDRLPVDHPGRAQCRKSLTFARANGFTVGLTQDLHREAGTVMAALAADPSAHELTERLEHLLLGLSASNYELTDIEDGERYDVGVIAAPVFDGSSRVIAAISATGFPPAMPTSRLRHVAEAVRAAAVVATRAAGGRAPTGR